MTALVSEAALRTTVLQMARLYGWMRHYEWDSRILPKDRDGEPLAETGFPDLVLCHPEKGLLFAELKTEKGRVSKAQRWWIWALGFAGYKVHIWRPADLDNGTIERVLRGER